MRFNRGADVVTAITKPIVDSWPLHFRDQISIGNLESNVGIVTLWTQREFVARQLDAKLYAVIGQLYSKKEGINAIIRNCLANKNIRHLIILGSDLNGSGEVLLRLLRGDATADDIAIVDKEIPEHSLRELWQSITVHDMRGLRITEIGQLNETLKQMQSLKPYGDAEIFPRADVQAPETFPSERTGFVVRERYIGEAWLRVLQTIMRFGTVRPSHYEQRQREVINLVTVIEDEDPEQPLWWPFYIFSREQLDSYIPQMTTDRAVDGICYTYGERLRKHFGVDQIDKIVDTLKAAQFSRRAVACTWDPQADSSSSEPPCLDLVQALVSDGKLYLTAYFRSNDMFGAWPPNAYALRALQKLVADKLGLPLGPLTTISCSAHLYESDWRRAQKILDEHALQLKRIGDPRGNIVIRTEDGMIKVVHLGPDGQPLSTYSGTTALELASKLALDRTISDAFHMHDIGAELQKAEVALKLGIKYVQDQALDFMKKN